MSRFSEEMKVVPRSAWIIATVLTVCTPLVLLGLSAAGELDTGLPLPVYVVGALICVLLFFYILLLGYVAGDSRRRGMRPVLWVLLAIFIPNAIGIILYFILRDPILRSCPQCSAFVNSDFVFCSACGANLGQACPGCRKCVEPGWSHCPRCGANLRAA
jgi:hypothetical protein